MTNLGSTDSTFGEEITFESMAAILLGNDPCLSSHEEDAEDSALLTVESFVVLEFGAEYGILDESDGKLFEMTLVEVVCLPILVPSLPGTPLPLVSCGNFPLEIRMEPERDLFGTEEPYMVAV